MRQGLRSRRWTVGVELVVEQVEDEAPVESTTQELVFERENQAVLSSDELRVLHRWWKELSPKLKSQVRSQEATIIVVGYASSTGNDEYNWKLGKDRASQVLSLLCDVIGRDEQGKCIAKIMSTTEGEFADDPNRYVKIIIQ